MKKLVYTIAIATMTLTSFTSCKENTKLENLEDKLEQRGEDLKDASDEIGKVANDIESALENFKDALKDVDNAEDREKIRVRVNEIFDSMKVEIEE